jgi:rare lipoprotein A
MKSLWTAIVLLLLPAAAVLAEEVSSPATQPPAIVRAQPDQVAADKPAAGVVTGVASWYGGKFQGRKTASGEIFDTRAFTAAHQTLPFGTMIKVTNLDTGRTTTVRITDRGPFVDNRIIDVSQAAAIELDMMKTGVARVSLEVLDRPAGKRGSFYRIQVASFKERENARKMKSLLAEKGLTVYLETVADGYIRVHVDNVAAADLASVQERLRSLGYEKHLVKKID